MRNLSSASMGSRSGTAEDQAYHKSHSYPGNISLQNIMYFWFAPTLCYQLKYPRSERVSDCADQARSLAAP